MLSVHVWCWKSQLHSVVDTQNHINSKLSKFEVKDGVVGNAPLKQEKNAARSKVWVTGDVRRLKFPLTNYFNTDDANRGGLDRQFSRRFGFSLVSATLFHRLSTRRVSFLVSRQKSPDRSAVWKWARVICLRHFVSETHDILIYAICRNISTLSLSLWHEFIQTNRLSPHFFMAVERLQNLPEVLLINQSARLNWSISTFHLY